MNTNYNVQGELIFVKKILEKQTNLDATGTFKNVVEIIDFGAYFKDSTLKVGDKVLVREHCVYECLYTKECYIYQEGILRIVN